MKFFRVFTSSLAVLGLTSSVLGAAIPSSSLTINPPSSLIKGEPVEVTWQGGTPPYFASVISATDGSVIQNFGELTGASFTFTPTSTTEKCIFKIIDSQNNQVQSDPIQPQAPPQGSGSAQSTPNSAPPGGDASNNKGSAPIGQKQNIRVVRDTGAGNVGNNRAQVGPNGQAPGVPAQNPPPPPTNTRKPKPQPTPAPPNVGAGNRANDNPQVGAGPKA